MIRKNYYYIQLKPTIEKVLTAHTDRKTARQILRKSPHVYRALREIGPDVGKKNPLARHIDFALTFLAIYLAHDKRIAPEILGEAMLSIANNQATKLSKHDIRTAEGKEDFEKRLNQIASWQDEGHKAEFPGDYILSVQQTDCSYIINVERNAAEKIIVKSGGKKLLPQFDAFDKRIIELAGGDLDIQRSGPATKYTITPKK